MTRQGDSSLEALIQRSRTTDRLYRESCRDGRLMDAVFWLSMSLIVGGFALVLLGVTWGQWLPVGGAAFGFAETLYLSPRRQRRLKWFRDNALTPRPAPERPGGDDA